MVMLCLRRGQDDERSLNDVVDVDGLGGVLIDMAVGAQRHHNALDRPMAVEVASVVRCIENNSFISWT
jgi:hypothetical protein